MYQCRMCVLDKKRPFKVPADEIGIALMQQHLLSKHDVKVPLISAK